MNNRLIKSNDAGGGGCTDTVDLYNPFPDGGGVALYQLNGDATDVSGNYDGTATDVTYGAGEFGQAGVFNGSSSEITNSGTVNVDLDFSVSLWFNNQGEGTHPSQTLWNGENRDNGLSFNYTTNTVLFGFYDGTLRVVETPTISSGWNNVVVTRSKTSGLEIYLNGTSQDTNSFTGNASSLTAVETIGNLGRAGIDRFFNGSIDQVRIFSRALRPYEVEALYTEEYCTPTIVPSEHFNTVTYTGNGSTQSITGVGFQPDFTWIKVRTNTDNHILQDSVRGVGKGLFSDLTNAENASMGGMTSFDSDGFTFDGSISSLNYSARDFVSWNFKAGGAAVTNTDGTITSQVSANTEAGFSIVTFTGNGQTGVTVGHGLGTTPAVVINKGRANLATYNNWYVWHKDLPNPNTDLLILNNTDASASDGNYFGGSPTDSTLIFGNDIYGPNVNGTTYVNYVFSEVEGFSNFGSYVGTGASGNTVVTGFEPAFVMLKRTDSTSQWLMYDNKRGEDYYLYPNLSAAESGPDELFQFLENGFQLTGGNADWNANGGSYIYMAFAADPTTIEPSLEDSFNTVLYSGNNTGQSITGVGFQPDLTWIKTRDRGYPFTHRLTDSVRGVKKQLSSELTDVEVTENGVLSFDSDGFTLGDSAGFNISPDNFVAWNWKGAELPAINSNGSIPSVVSANPAAGFSIVSYTGAVTGANKTIGHGLNTAPAMVIVKDRDWGVPNWFIWHQGLSGGDYYLTFTTAAQTQNSVVFSAAPTSSVVNLGIDSGVGDRADSYIAYCFAEVAGFSKFGSYAGTGVSGEFISTSVDGDAGFEPAFVMIRNTGGPTHWFILDNKRGGTEDLRANLSNAEETRANGVTFVSNGFEVDDTSFGFNQIGSTYIYMAFANQF